ncbi:MAG TPA: CsbD family protein [Thermoanaerobaculia bacterium]|nr:CsbD family protein [Thermoanaerobaculia bacterium]
MAINRSGRTDEEEAAANKVGGVVNQIKGNVKEAWGDLTGSPERKHEGVRDRVKGRIQEEYGEIKEKESRLERDLDDLDRGRL